MSFRPPHFNRRPRHSFGSERRSWNGRNERRATERKSPSEEAFLAKTCIDPTVRLKLEEGSNELGMRAVDLICPIGKGQRGLIVSPPKAGKTTLLKNICQSLSKSYPSLV